jgi:hypothetical protein
VAPQSLEFLGLKRLFLFVLCYIADLAHHPILLLEKPLTEFMYDTDPKQSAESRAKMPTMLAQNRTRLLAYHFAFPGIAA